MGRSLYFYFLIFLLTNQTKYFKYYLTPKFEKGNNPYSFNFVFV